MDLKVTISLLFTAFVKKFMRTTACHRMLRKMNISTPGTCPRLLQGKFKRMKAFHDFIYLDFIHL
jgi:hypothetical protein